MTRKSDRIFLPVEGEAIDRSRCPLCGEPNACVMASPDADPEEKCWCVDRTFPALLTDRATALDGGAACVCAACLEADA